MSSHMRHQSTISIDLANTWCKHRMRLLHYSHSNMPKYQSNPKREREVRESTNWRSLVHRSTFCNGRWRLRANLWEPLGRFKKTHLTEFQETAYCRATTTNPKCQSWIPVLFFSENRKSQWKRGLPCNPIVSNTPAASTRILKRSKK